MMTIIKHKYNNNSMHDLIVPRSVSFGSFGSFGSLSILGPLASGGLSRFMMDRNNRRCFALHRGENNTIINYTNLLIQKKPRSAPGNKVTWCTAAIMQDNKNCVDNNFKVTKGLVRGFHNSDLKLNPWFITGLIDAEGSFGVNLTKNNLRKLGYVITYYVEIALNFKDKALLEKINATLKVGHIYYNSIDRTYK